MFEWDELKAFQNLAKHGISFEEAATVFADPEALDGPDPRHSSMEPRWLRIGRSRANDVLVVAYTVRRRNDGEIVRLIGARTASRKERTAYSERS